MKTLIITMMLLCSGISVSYSLVLHVPLEYPTIQAGIDAAVEGDTVLVAPGEYTGTGNWEIDFLGKAILVASEMGPDSTFVGENPWDGLMFKFNETYMNSPIDRGFIFENNETSSSILRGFSITDKQRAIYIEESAPCIDNCKIVANGSSILGPDGAIDMRYSSPLITDCDIAYNTGYDIAAIYSYNSDPLLYNTRIYNNWSLYGVGGISINGGNPVIINCVFYNNGYGMRGGGATLRNCIYWYNFSIIGSNYDITYTDYDYDWPGEGNINEDPLFVDPENFDLRLQPDSPCIDAGDPDDPNVPWGGFRRDMGAFEFDQGFFWNGQCIILKPFPIEMPSIK